jgi:DNA-directed RNA polymerase specialized sigma24 family protein
MSYSLILSESRPDDPLLDEAWSQLKHRLSSGDPDSWNEIFNLLYPVAFHSARVIPSGKFESECEDVAMETLAEILNQSVTTMSAQCLKPLTAAIARNKSKDLLRRKLSEKRGGNNIESLDQMVESNGERALALPQADFLDVLTIDEVRELLSELAKELKKEYRLVLKDHFFDHLSHTEIAEREISRLVQLVNICSVGFPAFETLSRVSPSYKANSLRHLQTITQSIFCFPWSLRFNRFHTIHMNTADTQSRISVRWRERSQ